MNENSDIHIGSYFLMFTLEMNENNIDALFGIGEILFENGDTEKAKDYLERTLKIYPQHEQAADLLEGILHSL